MLGKYFFFCPLLFSLQFEGKYERHNQLCSGMSGVDLKWSLEVKKDIFVLQIERQTNQYISKPVSTSITGTWQESADTLDLFQWGKKKNILRFVKKGDKLIFLKNTQDLQNANLLYLDYLESVAK